MENKKPLYTLDSIAPTLNLGVGLGMKKEEFYIECRGEEGFRVAPKCDPHDYFQVVNLNNVAMVYLKVRGKIDRSESISFEQMEEIPFGRYFMEWLMAFINRIPVEKNRIDFIGQRVYIR